MEYIEPKPVEVDLKKKKRKKIITGATCGLLAAGLAVGVFFLISKVFIEYENINLYTFNYDDTDPKSEATISAVREDITLPKKLRLPTRFKQHPITALADEVFLERKDVKEIVLPDSLKSIGNQCFMGCENLVKISVPKSLESVGTEAFERTGWFNSFADGSVVQFGDFLYSFKGQMAPNSAIFGSHNSPKESYFSGDKVYLSDYSHFSKGVFRNQSNLVYAEFPESMSVIPGSFLEGCSSLESVSLPSSLKVIEESSFMDCTELHVEGFNDLSNLESIGDYALSNTKLSGEIVFNNIIDSIGKGVFKGCSNISKVTIGENFRNIPDYSFEGCSSLEDVIIPARETTPESRISFVGNSAFKGTAISEFYVPFNTTIIRDYAFMDCQSLVTLYAYENGTGTKINQYENGEWTKSLSKQGLIAIEKNCFSNSSLFQEIVLVDENKDPVSASDEVHLPHSLQYLGDINEKSDVFYRTSIKKLYLNGTRISVVSPSLCEEALLLTTVEFGDNSAVKSIGLDAFKGCKLLDHVHLPNTVVSLQTGIFRGCESLTDVTLSKRATSVSAEAFANCTALTHITIPSGYKSIDERAFAGCTALTTVVFMENYTSDEVFSNVGKAIFEGCTKLDNVVLPVGVKQYAESVFSGTKHEDSTPTTIVINSTRNTLTTISKRMFENSGIESLYLTPYFKKIEDEAFKNSSLKNLTLAASQVVTPADSAFTGTTLEHIYVPEDRVNQYKTNAKWSTYSDKISGLPTYTITYEKGDYGTGYIAPEKQLEGYRFALPYPKYEAAASSTPKRFKAWLVNGSEEKAVGAMLTLEADMTLTALWEDTPQATVSFDGNGGSGTMAPVNVYEGNEYVLPTCAFVAPDADNQEFKAWLFDGVEYDAGDSIIIDGDATIKALYQDKEEVEPDTPEDDDDSDTETSEEKAKRNTSLIATIILIIAGSAVSILLVFFIVRAIVLKKIYG